MERASVTQPSFLEISDTAAPDVFGLTVTADLCVGPPDSRFLFGGVGLAASIAALERACAQPLIWATAQYLSFARPGQDIELEVTKLAASRYTTQASVVGRCEGEVLFSALGALGERPGDISRQWAPMPDIPGPELCPAAEHWRGGSDGLHEQLEVRVAKGRYGKDRIGAPEADARLLLWVRPKHDVKIDAPMLAVIADLLPNGVGNALGLNAGGNSLDNSLRILSVKPTPWVLAEIAIDGISRGFVHGDARLFSAKGDLLGVASQTLVMRIRDASGQGR